MFNDTEEKRQFLLRDMYRPPAPSTQPKQPQKEKKSGWTAWLSELGGMGGAGAGAALGTAVLPGLGTLIGGGLGGLVGGFGGKLTEQRVRDPEESIGTSLRKAATEGAIEGAFGAGPIRLSKVGIQGAKALAKGGGKEGAKEASQEAAQRYADKLAKPGLLSRVRGRAANEMLGASPGAFTKASDAGIDLTETYQKWAPKLGKNYDEILGTTGTKGGNLRATLKAEEDVIQSVAKQAGPNIRISGDDIIKELKTELKDMGTELGGEKRREAMKAIIKEAESKYRKGVSVNQALKDLRTANAKFGASVLDNTGDAIAKAAQKAEANGLRASLKRMFPDLESALDNQSELITLREVLKNAASKSRKGGFDFIGASGIAGLPQRLAKSEPVSGRLARPGLLSRVAGPETMENATEMRRAATGGLARGLTGAAVAQSFVPDQPTAEVPAEENVLPPGTEMGLAGGLSPEISGMSSGLESAQSGAQSPFQDPEWVQQAYMSALQQGDAQTAAAILKGYEMFTASTKEKPLSAEASKVIATANSGLSSLTQLGQIIQEGGVPKGTVMPGRGMFGGLGQSLLGTTGYDAAADNVADAMVRARTGAAATKEELALYRRLLPQAFDPPEEQARKMQAVRDYFTSIANRTGSAGTDTQQLIGEGL